MDSRPQGGITLIELLFALAIAAILAASAAPSFRGVMARSHVATTNNALVGALDYTRQRAVTAGHNAVICPSRDGVHCDATMHWEHGWLVALDRDGDGQPDTTPLVVQNALPEGTIVLGSSGRMRVRYHPDGSAPGTNLSLVICHRGRARDALKVVVSNSGRPRQAHASAEQAARCAGS